jgi:uncharacterized MAPEG superfamily protein
MYLFCLAGYMISKETSMPQTSLTPELFYLTLTAMFVGSLWVPLIANRLIEMGVWKALSNPQPDVRPDASWAYRLSNAHRNGLENLAVFTPLAIAVSITGVGNDITAALSLAFFVSRVAHAFIYTLGIPLLRTIAFFIGFVAQVVLTLRLLGVI